MFQRNPLLQEFPPYLKLIFLLIIVLSALLLTMIAGLVIAVPFFGTEILSQLTEMGDVSAIMDNIPFQKYLQIVSQLGTFIIPSLLFAFLAHRKVWNYLALDEKPMLLTVILATCLILFILPFISWVMTVNEALQLPEFLSGLESWMKNSEEQAMKLTQAFLSDTTLKGLIVNLVMIGLLASIGEELLFRGVLIRLFREWFGNYHAAIWLSAILFSALHLQFYGFLPRMLLGVVLGYLFVWSGSLWVPIIAHFINNASAVFVAYLHNKGSIETDVESFGNYENTTIILMSFVISAGLLAVIYYQRKRNKRLMSNRSLPSQG